MDWHNTSSLQLVINDLNEIAADAYRHRIRTRAKKGGNGVYDTSNGGLAYLLPRRFELNNRARFEIIRIMPDCLEVKAVSLEDSSLFLTAVVDGRGQLTHLELPGASKVPPLQQSGERQHFQPQSASLNPARPFPRLIKVFEDS